MKFTYGLVHNPEPHGYVEISRGMTGERRWVIENELVVQRADDGTFWRIFYDEPKTENQEWADPSTEVDAVQVWPAEKTVTVYVTDRLGRLPA